MNESGLLLELRFCRNLRCLPGDGLPPVVSFDECAGVEVIRYRICLTLLRHGDQAKSDHGRGAVLQNVDVLGAVGRRSFIGFRRRCDFRFHVAQDIPLAKPLTGRPRVDQFVGPETLVHLYVVVCCAVEKLFQQLRQSRCIGSPRCRSGRFREGQTRDEKKKGERYRFHRFSGNTFAAGKEE